MLGKIGDYTRSTFYVEESPNRRNGIGGNDSEQRRNLKNQRRAVRKKL